jgi:type VI secretion system protein ImpH
MVAEDRPDARALALDAELGRAPWAFHLFQALRRIECAHRDGARLGESLHPSEEPIRITQEPTLGFSPSPIASYTAGPAGVHRLSTAFFGLLGPNGALPYHLTEYVRDRIRNAKDPTFARFLDIFHHRMMSLFYRAFANAEPVVSYDRPESDRFAKYVGSLIGLGLPAMRKRDAVDDRAKLHFAGRYAPGPRNPEGLVALIEGYLGVPAEVEEYVGEWVDLMDEWRWRLDGKSELGRGTTLGKRAFLCQAKFRIILGPLDAERFPSCLPGGELHRALTALVRGYVGDELGFELRLLLGETAVEPWRLGGPLPLGRSCWLGARPASVDVIPPRDDVAGEGYAEAAAPKGFEAAMI